MGGIREGGLGDLKGFEIGGRAGVEEGLSTNSREHRCCMISRAQCLLLLGERHMD